MLKLKQIKALKSLGEPGHFRVGWKHGLSLTSYLDLRDRKLIEEHWTWASTTRPDVGITEAGLRELADTSASKPIFPPNSREGEEPGATASEEKAT